ncbi:Alpha-soluble NSF attachment protein [Toxocara canis]|uniref:Alpha-soluble NSF attachment protein n=1 Tax=Toxocara canis TaxID=6265 RepID=A0A0B2VNB4_TOXCA|nr:Alpha-soluble NSF attachment protein [Toxocara canis]
MAENEAKARKKFEEAEKKAKGGSGFLGSLFGGAKADEAADLFVQERQEEESRWQQRSNNEICCMEKGCGETFDNVEFYEEHYELFHRHQCSVCGLKFANTHRLELHSDEKHSSFFKAQLQLRPEVALFRCWDSECTLVFRNAKERNEHSLKEHMIEDGEMKLEKRKLARKTWEGRSDDAVRGMAGNLFKISKLWKEAGDAFVRSAELHASSNDGRHDTASNYAEAANCYRKINAQLAVDCLMKTVEIYTDMGRFNMAAKNHCTIAELYENECPDMAQCMAHYQKAADFYKGEESKSSATKCLIKVAQYAAQLEQYRKAIQVFEEIATWEADHPTLKYAAKNHFFQALLCYLCVDVLDTQHALKRYEEISPSFADTREYKLIRDLIACIEEQNQDHFTDTVKAYDKISRLDPWHTALLVKIKRSCGEGEDDLK